MGEKEIRAFLIDNGDIKPVLIALRRLVASGAKSCIQRCGVQEPKMFLTPTMMSSPYRGRRSLELGWGGHVKSPMSAGHSTVSRKWKRHTICSRISH
jgi:hypothetical protein